MMRPQESAGCMGWQDRRYSSRAYGSDAERPGSFAGSGVHLFRAMGIPVRVDVSLWILIAIMLFSDSGVSLTIRAVGAAMLLGSILLHEFGHCIAARWVGGNASEIVLGPMGGLAMVQTAQRPWPVFVSTAGGPAVNVLLCVASGLALWYFWGVVPPVGPFDGYAPARVYYDSVAYCVWWANSMNRMLLYFNLLPILPMDGGRIFHAILWRWLGEARAWLVTAWVGIAGVIAVIGWVVATGYDMGVFMGCILLSSIFYCAQQIAAGRSRRGNAVSAAVEEEPKQRRAPRRGAGWIARWRRARQQRAMEREDETLDVILAKVSAQGLDSLSSQERRFLEAATKRRQAKERTRM